MASLFVSDHFTVGCVCLCTAQRSYLTPLLANCAEQLSSALQS